MKITVEKILREKPCKEWTEKRLRKYLGKGKTLSEILQFRGVSVADKIWCASRFLPDKVNHKFAIWCARQCKLTIKEIEDYIDVIEKYFNGNASEGELHNAHRTAYRTVISANSNAYRGAYLAANWTTLRVANWAVIGAANWAAYWVIDRTANSVMRRKQLKQLKAMVAELEDIENEKRR